MKLVEIASLLDKNSEPVVQRATEPAFKGMEMYSWFDSGVWNFSLMVGTNRQKSDSEIRDPGRALIGTMALKSELAALAEGGVCFGATFLTRHLPTRWSRIYWTTASGWRLSSLQCGNKEPTRVA
ncbi:MAG: hypothetical protein GY747_02370 [Planctomycetes bacterium]|nr:hypothetical protein [Planctomycetota bacterium]MCP4770256.1 hypothetical protein [Planctomycetota bacterium]MCP4860596.1 hypothetical protein [Planctomycetota bacterium]